jgi:hypothetical protein
MNNSSGLGCGSHLEPLFYEGKKMNDKIKKIWGKFKLFKLFIPHYFLIKKHKRVCSLIIEYNFKGNENPPFEYKILHKFFKEEFGINLCCIPASFKEAMRYQTPGNKYERIRITIEGNLS